MGLLELLKPKEKPKTINWQIQEGHVIVPAFICGGRQYYALQDAFNTFTERGFQALAVYDEWNNRMTHDNLKAFIEVMNEQLSGKGGSVDLSKIYEIVGMIKERIEWPVPTTELLYKMAGVAFFDENESPYVYDAKYAIEKIAFWKANVEDSSAFFINVPISLRAIFPLPNISVEDLKVCEEVINATDEKQLQRIIGMTSNAMVKRLLSQGLKSPSTTG